MKREVIYIILFIAMVTVALVCSAVVVNAVNPSSLVGKPSPIDPGFDPIGNILGTIRVFGSVASICTLIVLGIMYLTAAPEGKVQLKGRLVPFMIGAILLFVTTNIVSRCYKLFKNM